jgi:hypothetical protein
MLSATMLNVMVPFLQYQNVLLRVEENERMQAQTVGNAATIVSIALPEKKLKIFFFFFQFHQVTTS